MTRDMSYMIQEMHNGIRILILFTALFFGAVNEIWAEDNINPDNVIIEFDSSHGGITKNVAGRVVTITVTPKSGYFIKRSDIVVQKLVDPSLARTHSAAPSIADYLPVSGPSMVKETESKTFSFTIPEGYQGALVNATFQGADNLVYISSTSSGVSDPSKTYILTENVSASVFSGLASSNFTGILDGNGYTISDLSNPLFASTKDAIIMNVMFTGVSISSGTDVGAITGEASGTTRIYNCGILPSSVERDNDGNITGFSGCTVGGSGNVGGLVGKLSDNARVINCFSYATITGGSNVGGIVGYNNVASSQSNVATMVMNCMFYGDITGGTTVSPVYGGKVIDNRNSGGLNNFNYYAYDHLKTRAISDGKYNCALAVEEKYLTRFEIYRQLLNSNKKLAAIYATGDAANTNEMAKWVLETADRSISGRDSYPYPILKAQGKYPSIINPDIDNAPDSVSVGRNKGGKLGKTLSVSISSSKTNGGQTWPTGASITTSSLTLQRTDKDFDRYNFNYDKVQLPYYNDVGKGNYTGNRVVTGWKITAITTIDDDPYTADNYPTSGIRDYPDHNYADRKSSNKDLYTVSGRVFSQGAYFDVPYGVTSITIEPYWAQAAYVSDEYLDVVCKKGTSKRTTNNDRNDYISEDVTTFGKQFDPQTITINGSTQTVYTSISSALGALNGSKVYDNAVVLVGNLHQIGVPSSGSKAFTLMSVDLDKDNEPDYSYIYCDHNRYNVSPIRFDFLNIPGMAQAQKPNGSDVLLNAAIFKTKGWFEITNTALIYFTQFEYENLESNSSRTNAPLILLGGYIDQFVSTQKSTVSGKTIYIHVGSNVLINSFGLGTHSDGSQSTPHVPVSVTGGDYNGFYLTGTYNQDATVVDDNAECYISGGRFGELAGAAQEQIGSTNSANNGNIRWQIYYADITNFYGGGINDAKPAQGNITTDIYNSHVTTFCGGPKFGNMATGKKVTTKAEGCTFGKYFGAGFGGNSFSRKKYTDVTSINWAKFVGYFTEEKGKYYNGSSTASAKDANKNYGKKGPGVATDFDYELFPWTSGQAGVRFFVKFVSFSLAKCNDVESTLKKCVINDNFYGGGNLGIVLGKAKSTLEDCQVIGNVFGAGYSATLPVIPVRTGGFITDPKFNESSGMYEPGVYSGTTDYAWEQVNSYPSEGGAGFNGTQVITTQNLSKTNLGSVGSVDLTLQGNTIVGKSVYGGGEESAVGGDTEVAITGGTIGAQGQGGVEYGNVYGGGQGKRDDVTAGLVKGSTKVTIENTKDGETILYSPTIYHNVYGGGAYGSVGDFDYDATTGMPTGLKTTAAANSGKTQVEITGGTFGWNGKENGMVFGSSRGDVGAPNSIEDKMAWVYDTEVKIGTEGSGSKFTTPIIKGSVYGGGENGHNLNNSNVYIYSGTIGIPTGTPVTSGGEEYSGAYYPYRGNVYGGGCGTDKYYDDPTSVQNPYDGKGDHYNPLAGIVKGNATVNISGGYVVHNVYGAGAMGSVGTAGVATSGKTTVTVSGGRIGYDGDRNGNVFGAARGEFGESTAASSLANVRESEVNISYTTTPTADDNNKTTQLITGSVFGGGESGIVKESVTVKMTGGLILKDLYGGGALADTQTSNWDATNNTWAAGKSSASTTTTVRLTGGTITGEAYGGGLGEAGKPAYVWGDVLVDLNGTTSSGTTGTPIASSRGCAVKEVFGGNNINGSPKGNVMVHVYATQNKNTNAITPKIPLTFTEPETGKLTYWTDQATSVGLTPATIIEGASTDEAKINLLKAAIEANRYDVMAIYGGGNQAAYVPETAYHPTNAPDGSKTQVIIEGCATTSIETVYGGGNAAAVPETNVEILSAYEIQSVFGGGNGYSATDNHSDPSAANYNPGADVGVYKEGTTEKTYGTGNANAILKGGFIHEAYGGSNQKGNIKGKININTAPIDGGCDLCVDKLVGAGKNADVDGDLIMVLGCKPTTKTPLVFAGADNADVNGNVELTITSGTFGKVFGGNNLGGVIKGHLVLNIEETGCNPIRIDELYLGGNEAAYSVYGYNEDKSCKTSGDPVYAQPVLNVISATSIGKVFGGGLGEGAKMYADPTVNINMIKGTATGSLTTLGTIGDVYGGGDAANVIGNTTVNIGTETKVRLHQSLQADGVTYNMSEEQDVLGANITGNVYGGGKKADVGQYDLANDQVDVTGNTYVNIGAKGTAILDNDNKPTGEYNYAVVNLTGINIGGNVFGGGEGEAAESGAGAFKCAKAIVTGGTNIHIGNGTVSGTVYGGGEVGRVEGNSVVAIGIGAGSTTPASAPIVLGDVFGAGKGKKTHGYSALLRGNTTVTIEGDAKVRGSVYGGGEIASVGKYNVKKGDNDPIGAPADVLVGMPYSLANSGSGYCTVIVQGNAEIGPESEMSMKKDGGPDNTGHVFGAGKGVLPYDGYGVTDDVWIADPWRVGIDDQKDIFNSSSTHGANYEKEYFKFIETLALATETNVTIDGNAFVKGSVYGGSQNGHVQHDTHVTIAGGQIGQGAGAPGRYTDWTSSSLAECPHWDFDANSGAPYDPLATTSGAYDYKNYGFVPTADRISDSKGGLPVAKDGHTYYGNVFGGGSGVSPYAPGKWHRGAGSVGGDTYVNITGGHILTSVYGGNEHTDVGTYEKDASGQPTTTPAANDARGKCTVNMTGGTVGVPRTDAEKVLHPVVGNVFGAGKGDQRIFFNTWTNVINTEVNISGNARIYGSVFGGGEDGHVISDAETNIGNVTIKTGKDANGDEITESASASGLIIGTQGTSYYDGHVFGGGRGFSGEAQTAGTVGGNVRLNINAGSVYGSVYGGGRLASVGTQFTTPDDDNYGNFVEDETGANGKKYGHVTVNISGGTIGNANATGDGAKYSGNVFGGSMGRLDLLNGTRNSIWPKMAQVKYATVNISGDNTTITRSVFGGGELGTVREDAAVTISGGTIRRDVYGGGYGSLDRNYTVFTVKEKNSSNVYEPHTYAFTPMQFAGCVGKSTTVNIEGGYIRKSVYGGGEMASVGVIDCRAAELPSGASTDDKVYFHDAVSNKDYYYENMVKHADATKEFALSWPYEFNYVDGFEGATHVKVTGGRLGLKTGDTDSGFEDNGDVYGAGKGKAGDYKDYVFCANVGSTDVEIDHSSSNGLTAYSGTADLIAGAVYGGGEDGHVMGNTKVTMKKGFVYHSLYGAGSGKGQFETTLLKIGADPNSTAPADHYTRNIYSITAGKVFGNSTVEMSDGTVVRNIYGGGNMGSVGKGNYAGGSDDYSTDGYGEKVSNLWSNTDFLNSGKCTVKITGGTVGYIDTTDPSNTMYPYNSPASLPYGNVFGGCRGESAPNITESPRYLYSPEFFVGYANETSVEIGKADGTGPTILGSVYGGGMDGHIRRDASVTIKGGEIGIPYDATNKTNVKTSDPDDIQWLARGNVYGAGSGIGKYKYDFNYDNDYTDVVTYNGKQIAEEDFSTSAGSVTRFTKVDIQGGTIHRNVYGGGSLASIGAPKIPINRTDNPIRRKDSETGTKGKQTLNEVVISGGQIGGDYSYSAGTHVYGGHVFGGSRGDATLDATKFSTSMFTSVTIGPNTVPANSPVIEGCVFGGGEVGIVKGSVEVNINGGTVNEDVYGGGALANTNTETSATVPYTTTVNLFGGLIKGDAYGGGLGQLEEKTGETITKPAIAAMVYGDVAVNLGKEDRSAATGFDVNKYTEDTHAGIVKSGRVFGCNNLNGSPQGTVTVTVNKTVKGNTEKTALADKKSEDATKHSYHVAAVYGGGNLAGKTAGGSTNVLINGCAVSIRSVYGGGNAAAVPATDVLVNGAYEIGEVFGGGNGKDDYTLDGGTSWTTNPGANVNGNTNTLLLGGLIHEAYGGSNEKGTITGNVSINTADGQPEDCQDCPLDVEKIVGAGKNADVDGDLIMVLGCKPATKTPLVFGGADNANVNGNVELTITSGTFGKVFGGNNQGGAIKGHIVLNIEETGCNPIKIDELYLGGNEAAYSVYGYTDGTCKTTGAKAYDADPKLNVVSCTSIGKVFGGGLGAGAIMYADPTVNINMIPGAFANDATKGVPAVMTAMNLSSDDNPNKLGVIGDVYGGGNAADVIGNPTVNIGTAATVRLHQSYTPGTGYTYSADQTVKGAYITGNVFGAGMGKADEFTCAKAMVGEVDKGIDASNNPLPGGTSVVIAKGTVIGNVYGGGEIGRVERNTKVTIGVEGDQTSVPIIKGNVFGAGKGLETHGYSALVRGNAEVIIQGGAQVWQTVHGGGEKASVGRYNVRLPGDTQHPEVKVGMPYSLKAGGKCTVMIQDGATIGKEANTGDVYGAGQGITPAYNNTQGDEKRSKRMVTYTSDTDYPTADVGKTWDYYADDHRYVWEYFTSKDDYLLYMETLARASETDVIIGGKRATTGESAGSVVASSTAPTVKGSVYGGSESGFVYHSTAVNMLKGTVKGDVFGGGKGLESYAEAGRVRRNTNLTISGGTVEHNVYGGGSLGDVGIIDKSDKTDYNFKWKQTDGTTNNVAEYNKYAATTAANNTGICNVTISGGTIGTGVAMSADGTYANGNVYGAGKGLEDTWWCEKAMVFATNVNISAGTIKGTVYGGGEVGRVEDDAKVTIGVLNATGNTVAPTITGNVFGAGAGIKTHGYSALVRGNADVAVQGVALVGGNVYGGGEIASVGKFHVVGGLPTTPESGGYCTVTIQDNAKIGTDGTEHNVFGACKGVTPAYDVNNYKDVYSVQTVANTPAGSAGDTWDYYDEAHKFIKRYYKTETDYLAFLKTLALTSHPHVTITEGATVFGSVYGGGQRGVTLGSVDVDILGGTVKKDVYGGGALADTNLGNWDEKTGTWTNATKKSALYETKVSLLGGTIVGDAYGGGLGQLEVKTNETVTTPAIEAKVYGDVYMNLNGFDKNEVTYDAAIHGAATGEGARLELSGNEYLIKDDATGAVVSRIFGCNNLNGSPQGTVKVHVFKTQRAGQTRITNTSEVTTAKVQVVPTDGEYDLKSFDVEAVYGGGNMAAFVPADLTTGKTQVIIDGCDRTSIGQVYGGGNAASTPATEVTVNGSFEIAEVFGGGNGKDKITINGVTEANPGANVGFYDYSAVETTYDTKEKRTTDPVFISKYVYGTGKAAVNIYGGTIHRVFGGSNTKGNVRLSAITMLEDANVCSFCVDEAYGGGKSAPMDAEAKLLMACIPGLKEVYGGAQAADVFDNVSVTVTNGTFDRVFGGNNLSGTIRGKITVNIEETGCKPVVIGELYGGGNQAAYSVYGYKQMNEVVNGETKLVWKARESADDNDANGEVDAPTSPYTDPQVNVKSFTSIGTVYGGGYGKGAVLVGNPTVNINVVHGDKKDYYDDTTYEGTNGQPVRYFDATTHEFKELTRTIDSHPVTLPNHVPGAIGAIGNVFGGGNSAKVIGNTNVNVGTAATVSFVSKDDAEHTNVTVVGADIRGNVYGGGNNAEVTGNTNVQIGRKAE